MQSCALCSVNSYQSSVGSTACIPCPQCWSTNYLGAVSDSNCTFCSAGAFYQNSTCNDCSPGKFSTSLSSINCSVCTRGTYSDKYLATSCSICPLGSWSGKEGQSSLQDCQNCSAGRFSNQTALFADDLCSPCPVGKFNELSGSTTQQHCVYCPSYPGVSCNQEALSNPVILEGFWADGGQVFQCTPTDACTGGIFSSRSNVSTGCSIEYYGRVCSNCSPNYFRIFGKCRRCLDKAVRWLIISISAIIFAFLIYQASNWKLEIPNSMKICLYWFQVISMYPLISDNWPPQLKALFDISGLLNFEIGYFGVSCDVQQSFYGLMLFKLFLPLILFIILFSRNFCKGRKAEYLTTLGFVLFIMNFLSLQLFSTLFQIFNCTKRVDGMFVLTQDASEYCFSIKWYSFVSMDILFILLYVGLLPLFIWKRFVDLDRNVRSPGMKNLLGLLIQPYRPECWYFEACRLAFKLSFVLIRDVIPGTRLSKSLWLACVLSVQQWIESHLRPYQEATVNDISNL
jgi:hypothetical protein